MKKCEKCGSIGEDGDAFCTKCGGAMKVVREGEASSEVVATGQKDNSKIIALSIVSAICLVVGIVGIVLFATSHSNGGSEGTSNGGTSTSGDNSGGILGGNASSGTKVQHGGYEFTIPDGYEYELTEEDGDEMLAFTKDSNKYLAAVMYFDDATFSMAESATDELADSLGASEHGRLTIGGVEFLYFDVLDVDGMSVTYALSKADVYCFMTTILPLDGVINHDYLGDVAAVLKTAKKIGSNRSLSEGSGTEVLRMNKEAVETLTDLVDD